MFIQRLSTLFPPTFSRVLLFAIAGVLWSQSCWSQFGPVQENLKADLNLAKLGQVLFHDSSLSSPKGLSCATCHQQANAFSDGNGKAVSEGATTGNFGSRNTPGLTYAKYTPAFTKEEFNVLWIGGYFWDGRAASLEEQALGPFFNPLEMNTTKSALAKELRTDRYRKRFVTLFGKDVLKDDETLVNAAASAIANFERTERFSPFTSKYDYMLAEKVTFTVLETRGEEVFSQDGMCGECHLGLSKDDRQLFTNYEYHNIVLPKNGQSDFLTQSKKNNPEGKMFLDVGLAANPQVSEKLRPQARGLFKTPTLRNIALTPPYMHNGVFKTLREVVDFYIANDKLSRKVDKAEIPENRSSKLPETLELSEKDIEALIAFLNTLTDGYTVK